MTKQEYDRIVKESVAGGADPKDAAAYVTAGFKLPVGKDGKPVFEGGSPAAAAVGSSSGKREKRFSHMNKAELTAAAKEAKVKIDDSMTNYQIRHAIKKAKA